MCIFAKVLCPQKKLIHEAQIRKYKKIDPQIINPQLATFVEGPLI
jgi:hypothetical protein